MLLTMRRVNACWHAVFVLFCTVCAKVTERELVLFRQGTFQLTSEVGVSPLGRSSYVFKVMACGTAIIALSDIVSIAQTQGKYIMVFIGKKSQGSKYIIIKDSCFKCPDKKKVPLTLDCNQFTTFWLSWDNKGGVRLGNGDKLGDNVLIEYKSDKVFPIRFSQVTTLKPVAKFKFLLQEEMVLKAPLRDGSSVLTVKEDIAVGSVVYQIVVTPEIDLILVTKDTPFEVSGTELRTKSKLDFEDKRFYILRFKTMELNVNVTLSVIVEDVNDETPQVVLGAGIRIPEELPIGFIIGGVFSASDRDSNDILTYNLTGADSEYLSVIGMGQLRVEKRIDRDGPGGRHTLDKLTLHVRDSAKHDSAFALTLVVMDINDNSPQCTAGLFSKSIKETARSDQPIMNIPCSDEDSGFNGRFSLRIIPGETGEDSKKFWLSGFDLYADIDALRKESSKRENSAYILKLLAVDTPKSGQANTGTAVVILNLPHKKPRRANDYKPKWKSSIPDIKRNFPDTVVPEDTIPGTVIGTYLARDEDPGSLVAHVIGNITDDKGNNVTGPFLIDLRSGDLRTTGPLDCDAATGGVNYYNIWLMATDGENIVNGFLKVKLKNTNDNSPRFNKTVYTISSKSFKNFATPVLTLGVTDADKDSDITLSLDKMDHRYFRLKDDIDRWFLKFRPGIDPRENSDITPVIRITATDNGSPPRTGYTSVVITDLPCPANDTSLATTGGVKSVSKKGGTSEPRSNYVSLGSGTASGASPGAGSFTSAGIQTGVEDYDEGSQDQGDVSNIPENQHDTTVCVTPNDSKQDTRMELYLKVACAAEGLLIVMMTSLVLAKKCGCLKKSTPAAVHPERKEPVGCENALRKNDPRSSKKKDGKNQSKSGTSSTTPTPTPTPTFTKLDVVNEVPEPPDTADTPPRKACHTADSLTTQAALEDEMTRTAKNRFLGLRKKTVASPPVQLYSSSSGMQLYDNEMLSVARTKFLEKLKDPTPVTDSEAEMVYIAKDKFIHFLDKSPDHSPPEIFNHLAADDSDVVAIAKDKFVGLTKGRNRVSVIAQKETPPLDVLSLLDGSFFTSNDNSSMVTVAKDKFIDFLKDNQTIGPFLTGNDAIMEYAAGYNPTNGTVYIAKDKFFNLVKKPKNEQPSEELLTIAKDKLVEILKHEVDPWADMNAAIQEWTSAIDADTGIMYISKDKLIKLTRNINVEGSTGESMIAVTKPKLAELMTKNGEDPKCNDVLNKYVCAVSPVSGTVYMSKKTFLKLAQPGDETTSSEDVLEVDREHLVDLVQLKGGDIPQFEGILRTHTLGELAEGRMVYVSKSKFLSITTGGGDLEDLFIVEVSGETISKMTGSAGDLQSMATNMSSSSVFITKKRFMELTSQDYEASDMIMVSKEQAVELAKAGENAGNWQQNTLAVAPSSDKVFMARSKFASLIQKNKLTDGDGDADESEMVSVSKEQLSDMLNSPGDQKTNSFIRAHAHGLNPATGAIIMARKKFLDVAVKGKASGNSEEDIVSVSRDTLCDMVKSNGGSNSEALLSKLTLAFSGDSQTAFIAKEKFMALSKGTKSKVQDDSGSGMVTVTEDSLSELASVTDVNTSELMRKYATAFNPKKKLAYIAKDKFLRMAKEIASSKQVDEDDAGMVALPKDKLVDITESCGIKDGADKMMKHALAFSEKQNTTYMAKNRFMKLVERSNKSPEKRDVEGENEMVTVPQEHLEKMLVSGSGVKKAACADYVKKVAIAINPLNKMVYLSKNKFTEIARNSLSSAEGGGPENEIVGVSESRINEVLQNEGKTDNTILKQHALAFNKTSGQVYFLKRKFRELATKIPKGRETLNESLECESIVSTPNRSECNESIIPESLKSTKPESVGSRNLTSDSNQGTVAETAASGGYYVGTKADRVEVDLSGALQSGDSHTTSTRESDLIPKIIDPNEGVAFATNSYDFGSESESDGVLTDSSGDSVFDQLHGSQKPKMVLTITDEIYEDSDNNDRKRKDSSIYGKVPSRETKKKKKVKAWDSEVRGRLYGNTGGKGDKKKRKGKLSADDRSAAEMSDNPTGKKRTRKKSALVHPEPEVVTSETDEGHPNTHHLKPSRRVSKVSRKHKKGK